MGVMGSKVAWACARAGLETRAFDIDSDTAAAARERALGWSDGAERRRVETRLSVAASLASAVEGVQLAFENVPEDLALKRRVLGDIGRLAPAAAYMGSNASSLVCTPLAAASGRPERFFNLNFADPLTSRLTELMTGTATAPETVTFAATWARSLGMTPIRVYKEQMGYAFNRLWRVIKQEVLRQIDQGVATPEDLDRAWMLAFGTAIGPCGIMDEIGLHSVLAVERSYFEATGKASDCPPETLTARVARGELGVASGRGFYQYPDTAYRRPDFLDGDDTAMRPVSTANEREDP